MDSHNNDDKHESIDKNTNNNNNNDNNHNNTLNNNTNTNNNNTTITTSTDSSSSFHQHQHQHHSVSPVPSSHDNIHHNTSNHNDTSTDHHHGSNASHHDDNVDVHHSGDLVTHEEHSDSDEEIHDQQIHDLLQGEEEKEVRAGAVQISQDLFSKAALSKLRKENGNLQKSFKSRYHIDLKKLDEKVGSRKDEQATHAAEKTKDFTGEKKERLASIYISDAFHSRSPDHRIDIHPNIYNAFVSKYAKAFRCLLSLIILGLAFFEHPSPDRAPSGVTESIELICLILFGVDFLFECYVFTVKRKKRKIGDIFYVICWIICFLDLIVAFGLGDDTIRVSRALRPIFFVRSFPSLLKKLGQMMRTVYRMSGTLFMILFFNMVMSVLGFAFFSGIPDNPYFETFSDSFLSLFILLTTANFPDVMLPSYRSTKFAGIFFVVFLVFGLYLVMSLVMALVYDIYRSDLCVEALDRVDEERTSLKLAFSILSGIDEEKIDKQQWVRLLEALKPGNNPRKAGVLFDLIDSDNSGNVDEVEFFALCDLLRLSIKKKSRQTATGIISRMKYSTLGKWLRTPLIPSLKRILDTQAFKTTVMVLILLNGILVTIDLLLYDTQRQTTTWAGIIDIVFVLIFVVELILRILGRGMIPFFKSPWNTFDFFVILLSVVFKIASEVTISQISGDDDVALGIIKAIQVVRILRVVRLASVSEQLNLMTKILFELIIPLAPIALSIIVIFYSFAMIGMESLGGLLVADNPDLNGTDYAAMSYHVVANFNSLPESLMTLFHLMIVNNWMVTMYGAMAATSGWIIIYFLVFYFIAVVVGMNLVMAFVLEVFLWRLEQKRKEEKEEKQRRKAMKNENVVEMHDVKKTDRSNHFNGSGDNGEDDTDDEYVVTKNNRMQSASHLIKSVFMPEVNQESK